MEILNFIKARLVPQSQITFKSKFEKVFRSILVLKKDGRQKSTACGVTDTQLGEGGVETGEVLIATPST